MMEQITIYVLTLILTVTPGGDERSPAWQNTVQMAVPQQAYTSYDECWKEAKKVHAYKDDRFDASCEVRIVPLIKD